jgi:hypothetical protein
MYSTDVMSFHCTGFFTHNIEGIEKETLEEEKKEARNNNLIFFFFSFTRYLCVCMPNIGSLPPPYILYCMYQVVHISKYIN